MLQYILSCSTTENTLRPEMRPKHEEAHSLMAGYVQSNLDSFEAAGTKVDSHYIKKNGACIETPDIHAEWLITPYYMPDVQGTTDVTGEFLTFLQENPAMQQALDDFKGHTPSLQLRQKGTTLYFCGPKECVSKPILAAARACAKSIGGKLKL